MRFVYLFICCAVIVADASLFAGTGFKWMLEWGYDYHDARLIGGGIGGFIGICVLAFVAGAVWVTPWGNKALTQAWEAREFLLTHRFFDRSKSTGKR